MYPYDRIYIKKLLTLFDGGDPVPNAFLVSASVNLIPISMKYVGFMNALHWAKKLRESNEPIYFKLSDDAIPQLIDDVLELQLYLTYCN